MSAAVTSGCRSEWNWSGKATKFSACAAMRSAEAELKAAGIQPLIADITKPETLAKTAARF